MCRAAAGAAHRDDGLVLGQLPGALGKLAQRHKRGAADMAQGSGELVGLAHVQHLHPGQILLQPVRLDLPDTAEREAQGRPARIGRCAGFVARLATTQVGRHRFVDLLGMRQIEVLHVADIVALADLAAEPRIELLLLGDAGGGEAAIVVRRVEQAALGQGEDARPHGAIQSARVALLEIGAARAADHDAVAGEGHALVIEHVGNAAAGMAGRGADLERTAAKLDTLAVGQQAIGARGARCRREGDAAAELLLEQPGAGHMVGMDMGVERPFELQAEFADQRGVTADLLEHRIDQQRLARRRAAQQVGVSRRGRIEELAEDEHVEL